MSSGTPPSVTALTPPKRPIRTTGCSRPRDCSFPQTRFVLTQQQTSSAAGETPPEHPWSTHRSYPSELPIADELLRPAVSSLTPVRAPARARPGRLRPRLHRASTLTQPVPVTV